MLGLFNTLNTEGCSVLEVSFGIVQCWKVPYGAVQCWNVPYGAVQYWSVPHEAVQCWITLQYFKLCIYLSYNKLKWNILQYLNMSLVFT